MTESIQYGSTEIGFSIVWKPRKSLVIEVYPDLKVVVKAPIATSLSVIKNTVLKRSRWIIKQWNYFDQFLPRTPEREYVSGESHLYLGRKYLLKVVDGTEEHVKLTGGRFIVVNKEPLDSLRTKQLLSSWYMNHATKKFEAVFIEALQNFKFSEMPEFKIRRMKNRWGSCSSTGVISLNPEIIKAPTKCIEYVILHELCHVVHPDHSKSFYSHLESLMPDWKRWKLRLEQSQI